MSDDLLERAERLRAHILNMDSGSGDAALIGELIERVRAATEWQPIETAPKEATKLVLVRTHAGDEFSGTFTAYWSRLNSKWTYGQGRYVPNPTHWMPLPAPPSAKP